ncbi:nucleoporin interacting component (Nup93/Nic96-like) family protein [Actinidia rufa]|uniref:Nuclear pore protein n=1 Tax=Actinidia rufa TaxID=165716 RepID=A0A7J0DK34_9ERIC|nr:nucleoporin interacting component (Nup93/Nic96-like) family protein [Actinidia rufa]
MALDTVHKCLSEAICALSRGRLDGESRTAGLIHSGNEILEMFKYYPEVSLQEREHVVDQQTVLILEATLSIQKLARAGRQLDAIREVAKLPFHPFDPRVPDIANDVFQKLSPRVQAFVPDLLIAWIISRIQMDRFEP